MRRLTDQERGQLVDLKILASIDEGVDCLDWEIPILDSLADAGLVHDAGAEYLINDRGRMALRIDDALREVEVSREQNR